MQEIFISFALGFEPRASVQKQAACVRTTLSASQTLLKYVAQFFQETMNTFGVCRYWTAETIKGHTQSLVKPDSEYMANKSYERQLRLGLVNQGYSHSKRVPMSNIYTYMRLFTHHRQRISVSIFLMLYNRVCESETMSERYVDYRSMIVALEKQKVMLSKAHYQNFGLMPLSPDEAFFIVNEWANDRIELQFCGECGLIYAAPRFEESGNDNTRAIETRLQRCPYCQLLHLDDTFETPKTSKEVLRTLKTDF